MDGDEAPQAHEEARPDLPSLESHHQQEESEETGEGDEEEGDVEEGIDGGEGANEEIIGADAAINLQDHSDDMKLYLMTLGWRQRGRFGLKEVEELQFFLFRAGVNLETMHLRTLGAYKRFEDVTRQPSQISGWAVEYVHNGTIPFLYRSGVAALRSLYAQQTNFSGGDFAWTYGDSPVHDLPCHGRWWRAAEVSPPHPPHHSVFPTPLPHHSVFPPHPPPSPPFTLFPPPSLPFAVFPPPSLPPCRNV